MSRNTRIAWAVGFAKSIYERSIYGAATLLMLLLLIYVGRLAYFGLMPGEWFISYYDVQVASTVEGKDLEFRACRERRTGDQPATITRTFYRGADGETDRHKMRDAGRYTTDIKVEGGRECVDFEIPVKQYRHKGGYSYYFHTDGSFEVEGFRKTFSYDSSIYFVGPRPSDRETKLRLEQEIEQRQRELDTIEGRMGRDQATTESKSEVSRTNAPTTSAPPDPSPTTPPTPQPAPQEERGVLSPLLTPTLDLLNRTLQRTPIVKEVL